MKKIFLISFLIIISFSWLNKMYAQKNRKNSYNLRGLAFGDFYNVNNNHLEDAIGDFGFVLRRGYLTFNANFGSNWFGRFRLEVNQSGEFDTYTFTSEIQDFFIGYRTGEHTIIAGIAPTKTFDLIEAIWGLRYLTRTPLDLQGVPSRDIGISVEGPLDESNNLRYRVMLGNGTTAINEIDKYLKYMGAITWQPLKKWCFDFYLDYEKHESTSIRSTIQLFAAYKTEKLRWAFQYSNQYRQNEPRLELVSGYVVGEVYKNISLIARVDRLLKPSPRGNDITYLPFDPSAKATFLVSGVEVPISNHFTITPNVVFTNYDKTDNGTKPNNDLLYRVTMFLNFE